MSALLSRHPIARSSFIGSAWGRCHHPYLGNHYAGAWGTWFSVPLVAGGRRVIPSARPQNVADKIAVSFSKAAKVSEDSVPGTWTFSRHWQPFETVITNNDPRLSI